MLKFSADSLSGKGKVDANAPKDRVEALQEAMRKTFKDPEFHREYRSIVGEDAEESIRAVTLNTLDRLTSWLAYLQGILTVVVS